MYCTQEDLLALVEEARLIQLTDDEGAGALDADRVAQAIADACGEIDGYLGSRYSLPLATVPSILRQCAVDIALYNLHARRAEPPQERKDRHASRIAYLTKVATGAISLGQGDPDGTPTPTDAPRIEGGKNVFGRDGLRGF